MSALADLIVYHFEYKYVSPLGVLQLQDGFITGIVERPVTLSRISPAIYLLSSRAAQPTSPTKR